MGSKFLTGGSSLSLLALQDGSFDANLLSIKAQNLIPNYPAFSDNTKKIVSKKVDTGDCSFSVVSDLANTGTGLSVYKNITPLGAGVLRTLSSGGGISLTYSGTDDEIIISSAGGSTVDAVANVGTGAGVWKDTTGGTASLKSLIEGTGMTITSGTNDITIATTALTNLQNTGTGITISSMGVANAANIKSLVAGSGITITNGGTDITISAVDSIYRMMAYSFGDASIVGSTPRELAVAPIIMNNSFIPSSWLIAGATFEFYVAGSISSTSASSIDLRVNSNLGVVSIASCQVPITASASFECVYILQITSLNTSSGLLVYTSSAKSIRGLYSSTINNGISNFESKGTAALTLASPYTQLPWFITGIPSTTSCNWGRHMITVKQTA